MVARVFFIETQELVADCAVQLLADQVPEVAFATFDHVAQALAAAPSYDRVLLCVAQRAVVGEGAALLPELLARQPNALLVMIRGAADLLALGGLLAMSAAADAEAAPADVAMGAMGQPRLSEREREVLLLLREGLPNKQIARRLDVSVSTVKTHVANIFRKIGAGNRLDAICKYAALNRPAAADPLLLFRQQMLGERSAAMFERAAA